MNKKILVTFLIAVGVSAPVFAQDAPPPPLPVFDPSMPFNAPVPTPITPVTPVAMPSNPTTGGGGAANPQLPPLSEEDFKFFQPGYQVGNDKEKPTEKPVDEIVEIKPEEKKKVYHRLPLVRFNYKNQYLPHPIYQKQYNSENKHLPVARYEHDYNAAAFVAAARNDLNGIRSLVNAGRNINMVNEYGETLVMTATRYGAHDVLRYLLAKGAIRHQAPQIAHQQQDHLSHYALRAAGAPY